MIKCVTRNRNNISVLKVGNENTSLQESLNIMKRLLDCPRVMDWGQTPIYLTLEGHSHPT